jgi:DsbC/DsbD-like thiol-disulfide interchange protein
MRTLSPLSLCFAFLFSTVAFAGPGDRLVQAKLLADVSAVKPGDPFRVGVLLTIDPTWHIYWKNPGDSGLATKVKLNLPAGFTNGATEFPVPTRLKLPGDILNYAYENQVMLMMQVNPPKELPADKPIEISAKINWLVCKDICTPGSAKVSLELPVSGNISTANTDLFTNWTAQLPMKRDPVHVQELSRQQDLKLNSANRLAGTATILIHWKTTPTDVQWFPNPESDVILSDINVSNRESTTTITWHVDAPAGAVHSKQVDSVLAYTIDGKRAGLLISDPAK